MTLQPAFIHQLSSRKGKIAEGYDADLVVYKLQPGIIQRLHSKCDYSPYTGFAKDEDITTVYLRGHQVVLNQNLYPVPGIFLKGENTL